MLIYKFEPLGLQIHRQRQVGLYTGLGWNEMALHLEY